MPILSRRTATTRFSTGKADKCIAYGAKLLTIRLGNPGHYLVKAFTRWRHLRERGTHPINSLLLIYRPGKDKRLSWPDWVENFPKNCE